MYGYRVQLSAGIVVVMKSDIGSKAFQTWAFDYLRRLDLSEGEYDKALNAAEYLKFYGKVSHDKWIKMVRLANTALSKYIEAA